MAPDARRKQWPRKPKPRPIPELVGNTAYDHGFRGEFPKERNDLYLWWWTKGREAALAEHRDSESFVFQSSGMLKGADARVIRGSIVK
jgi:hypothetical protein